MKTRNGTRITTRSFGSTIADLHRHVNDCEQKYRMKTSTMLRKVRAGTTIETVEICKWLTDYHALRKLEGQHFGS